MNRLEAIPMRLLLLAVLSALISCNNESDGPVEIELTRTASHKIDVAEPSGLSVGFEDGTLFTVSDNENRVYMIDRKGHVIDKLHYEGHDLEDVTVRPSDRTIWVVEETRREVVKLSETGQELQRWSLEYGDKSGKGLEGISYNSVDRRFYLLNEAKAGMLIVWTPEEGIITEYVLEFAADYSGICCSADGASLWIISDQDESLVKTDLQGNPLLRYRLGVPKAEGIVVDQSAALVYAVSDSEDKLYVFDLE